MFFSVFKCLSRVFSTKNVSRRSAVNRSLILAVVGIVLLGALVADAKTIPVTVTSGNVSVAASRVASGTAGYDEVDFYLTGMKGLAAGTNNDGTQVRVNALQGRWTAHVDGTGAPTSSGDFWLPTNINTMKTRSCNQYWQFAPTNSAINFDSNVGSATIWTNLTADVAHGLPYGGGRDAAPVGNNFTFFSGSWYTSAYDGDLVAPANPNYSSSGTDSTYLAALFVTSTTPDAGIAYDGVISFTYAGGTTEVGHFVTTPEPCTLALLAAGLVGLVAYAWRKRSK
jgi:hypothetical protein